MIKSKDTMSKTHPRPWRSSIYWALGALVAYGAAIGIILPFIAPNGNSPLWGIVFPAMIFCEFSGAFDARLLYGIIASAALLILLAGIASRATNRRRGLIIFIGGWTLIALLASISQGYRFGEFWRGDPFSDADSGPSSR